MCLLLCSERNRGLDNRPGGASPSPTKARSNEHAAAYSAASRLGGRREAASGYNCGMASVIKEQRQTEQRLAASKNLDRMTALEIVRLMNDEDRKVAAAVSQELPTIA